MDLMVESFAYIEDAYRRERLAKDFPRSARHPRRLRTALGRALSRGHGEPADA